MNNEEQNPVIEVKNLTVKFNGFTAVDSINFDVYGGEVVGILGSNGAGKSSTMKVLSGVMKPSSGEVRIDGHVLTSVNEEEEAKKLIGYCPDVGGLVVGATPRSHVQLLLSLDDRRDNYDKGLYLIDRFGLRQFIDTRVGGFSHGMSRRLSVLLAVLASKKVLILDEPFDGVDPEGEEAITEVVQEAKNAGLAVIVCTHRLDLLTAVTDRIVVMNKGSIIESLPAEQLEGKEGAMKYRNLLRDDSELSDKIDMFDSVYGDGGTPVASS